jgi:tetratricopeptide (TPR) repeat protein
VVAAGFLIGLLLTAAAPAGTSSDAELLGQAEAAFQEGVRLRVHPQEARRFFRQAADGYEELRRRGIHNAALDRNLGNAALLAGDLPRAILAYRRGLRLSPDDHELRTSLAHARSEVVYPEPGNLGRPPVDHWPPWLPRATAVRLLALAVVFYALVWLAFTRWLMTQRGWLLAAGGLGLALVAVLAFLLMGEVRQARFEADHPLVVIARDKVVLRKGNGDAYPPRYDTPLNRGVEARLIFARNDWLQIELSAGEVGWVPRNAVLLDTPSAGAFPH